MIASETSPSISSNAIAGTKYSVEVVLSIGWLSNLKYRIIPRRSSRYTPKPRPSTGGVNGRSGVGWRYDISPSTNSTCHRRADQQGNLTSSKQALCHHTPTGMSHPNTCFCTSYRDAKHWSRVLGGDHRGLFVPIGEIQPQDEMDHFAGPVSQRTNHSPSAVAL